MKVIKGVLEEELENSLRQEAAYKKALDKIEPGVIVEKKIHSHNYYYLMVREGKKVRFYYKGKLSKKELEKYENDKIMRVKYRKLLSLVKKQISFLRKSLRAKEIRSA